MKKNNKQKEARFANIEYKAHQLELQGMEIGKSHKIIIKNDGKVNSSDAGFLLLQQVEQKHRIIEKLSDFFTDKRDPLYVFCDDFPLIARLRPSSLDACEGTEEILVNLVGAIRARFPDVRIIFRGDSDFCRESVLKQCEILKVKYITGMAGNTRLLKKIDPQMVEAEKLFVKSKAAERVFSRFPWKTQSSWSRNRDVIARVEHLPGKKNPRFIVTDIPAEEGDAQSLYEDVYCARGDMENRIKEQQLYLFADRTSSYWVSSNQLRLYFSTIAYIFFVHLRRTILQVSGDETRSMSSTIRLRMLKVSAAVKITVRRVWISLPESFPWWDIWIRTSRAI